MAYGETAWLRRMLWIAWALLLLLPAVSACSPAPASLVSGPYFDDSGRTLRLGNAHYEVGISSRHGAITYILDRATGERVSQGTGQGRLWSAAFPKADGLNAITAANYHPGSAARAFHWAWLPDEGRLRLTYSGDTDGASALDVQVDLIISEAPWFDLALTLHNRSGHVIERVAFPHALQFRQADLESILLPVMPGILLKPGVFQERWDWAYKARYPGMPGVFADYQAVHSTCGSLALYAVHRPDTIISTLVGPMEKPWRRSFALEHTFFAGIRDGERWTTPVVRVHLGAEYPETLAAYRTANGIDGYPSLRTKAGSIYDTLVASPLIKVDVDQTRDYYRTLPDAIPTPAILHWVSYWPYRFDEHYPDLLPPDPAVGTTEDLAALMAEANARGHLNMPYTNPTWWDDESPSFQGLDPAAVAVLDANGTPLYECYNVRADAPPCTPENAARDSTYNGTLPWHRWLHGGYVMSPHAGPVRQRVDRLVQEITTELPVDLVFQDQIGARPRDFDYNAAATSLAAYHDGWLAHTRAHAEHRLMTEAGYDRLAESEIGFAGSVLLQHNAWQDPARWWGAGNWEIYPVTAMLARDKALFYQHNLAPESFTHNLAVLRWDLASGYMLSYDSLQSEFGGGLDDPWLHAVSVVQSQVLAQYADVLATDYEWLAPAVTRTTFGPYTVIANWDDDVPFALGEHTIAPGGVLVIDDDAATLAGSLIRYNGEALAGDGHLLVERRDDEGISLWKPLGPDTPLAVRALPGWGEGEPVEIQACPGEGVCVPVDTASVSGGLVRFEYLALTEGVVIARYRLEVRPGQ